MCISVRLRLLLNVLIRFSNVCQAAPNRTEVDWTGQDTHTSLSHSTAYIFHSTRDIAQVSSFSHLFYEIQFHEYVMSLFGIWHVLTRFHRPLLSNATRHDTTHTTHTHPQCGIISIFRFQRIEMKLIGVHKKACESCWSEPCSIILSRFTCPIRRRFDEFFGKKVLSKPAHLWSDDIRVQPFVFTSKIGCVTIVVCDSFMFSPLLVHDALKSFSRKLSRNTKTTALAELVNAFC